MSTAAQFQWKQEPEAAEAVATWLKEACAQNTALNTLYEALPKQASARLFDFVDHLVLSPTPNILQALESIGYSKTEQNCYRHLGAILPAVRTETGHSHEVTGIAVSVDDIGHYLQAHGISGEIEGSPLGALRRCLISLENGVSFWVVERRAYLGMEVSKEGPDALLAYHKAHDLWMSRPRGLKDRDEAMRITQEIAEQIVGLVGKDLGAWIVCEGERWYWQNRNRAGQIQKGRQDLLGLGWANHDHHTFRSSRKQFQRLVHFFETLGFHCRERFYAGEQAGWGAQVMENTNCNITLFLDVDLSPEEVEIDYAHEQLPELPKLGTIGLWCALHGDSLLKAGMHHLEAQFLFDDLTRDLHQQGVGMMDPFSNFTYLKQAFTEGEVWQVDHEIVDELLTQGQIDAAQADSFKKYGAIGSHLENLERNDGYKGFNQKNVSWIIRKTDPRKQLSSI